MKKVFIVTDLGGGDGGKGGVVHKICTETKAHTVVKVGGAQGSHGVHTIRGENFAVNGNTIRVVKERDPLRCPWNELHVDIVVEATGHFEKRKEVSAHLHAGARRVIVTAPMKDDTPTFVLGVKV